VQVVMKVSNKMDPNELVKLIEILNSNNKPGRISIIVRMGAENMRVKLPHLIRAVRRAGQIVTWICDPIHGNTIKAPCGLKTRPFDAILVWLLSHSYDYITKYWVTCSIWLQFVLHVKWRYILYHEIIYAKRIDKIKITIT